MMKRMENYGTWNGVQGVEGSNPFIPTRNSKGLR